MKRQRGFTILETLIAFAILSVVTIVTYSAFADAITRATKTSLLAGAIDLAESTLTEHSVDVIYTVGHSEGTEGPYHWQLNTTPYLPNEQPRSPHVPVANLKIEVTWGRGSRGITLQTLAVAHYPSAR